jgi:hypothetical protein
MSTRPGIRTLVRPSRIPEERSEALAEGAARGDAAARERLRRVLPNAGAVVLRCSPLALEHGVDG